MARFGVGYQVRHPVVSFNNYPMLLEAVMAGEGVALGWRHLSESLLEQGRLLRPVGQEWTIDRYYYLAMRDQNAPPAELLALREWLLRAPSS